jgi:hypothetical protein
MSLLRFKKTMPLPVLSAMVAVLLTAMLLSVDSHGPDE